jgi:HlyD family secretion protein
VQHLEGGVVAETRVKNGDRVAEGDILVRLDESDTRTNLQIFLGQLAELKARQDRLIAERDDRSEMDVGDDPQAAIVRQAQAKLLRARLDVRVGKKQQLSERVAQLEQEVMGLSAQVDAKERQIALVRQELNALNGLRKAQLVTESRLLALEREGARLDGERGQLVSDIARTKVQIGETRLQLIAVDQAFLSEVLTELRDVEAKVNEITEKVAAVRTRLLRMEIRAPRSGFVHKLTATTVGGVIGAGEVIAEIIPEDSLVLEGHVDPGSIDRILQNQKTIVRFPSLDHRSTPEVEGVVTMISPDAKQDAQGQAPYYLVRVSLGGGAASQLGPHTLKPGMPAELLFQTGQRTVLSYLIKPLSDQVARAMKER